MPFKWVVNSRYNSEKNFLKFIIQDFKTKGIMVDDGTRNTIKKFEHKTVGFLNIKSFKKPHFINKIAYTYFRKSKAERSYLYAHQLIKKGFHTPEPIAYLEERDTIGLTHSYYISEHLDYDFTFRELLEQKPDNMWSLVEQFVKFTYDLHEKGIHFIDHSPGNTLIKKEGDSYDFYLIDLNRMEFKTLDFKTRMENFRRLYTDNETTFFMADCYAKYTELPPQKVRDEMLKSSNEFKQKFERKKTLKKKYLNR